MFSTTTFFTASILYQLYLVRRRVLVKKFHLLAQHGTEVAVEAEGLRLVDLGAVAGHEPPMYVHQEGEGDAPLVRVVCHTKVSDLILDNVVEDMPIIHITHFALEEFL